MKTQIVQQNNRKTSIEYFSRAVEISSSTTRKTKIFLDNIIQGSVELFVPSSEDSLSFASKTNVTQIVNTTKTIVVQNISGKTFLSGVVEIVNNNPTPNVFFTQQPDPVTQIPFGADTTKPFLVYNTFDSLTTIYQWEP